MSGDVGLCGIVVKELVRSAEIAPLSLPDRKDRDCGAEVPKC
jgi:hypothetical protein